MGYALLGMVLAKLFGLAFLLGLVLFLVWAIRDLKKKELKKMFAWLLIVGLVGMVAISVFMKDKVGKDGLHMKLWKWDKKTTVEEVVETPVE